MLILKTYFAFRYISSDDDYNDDELRYSLLDRRAVNTFTLYAINKSKTSAKYQGSIENTEVSCDIIKNIC